MWLTALAIAMQTLPNRSRNQRCGVNLRSQSWSGIEFCWFSLGLVRNELGSKFCVHHWAGYAQRQCAFAYPTKAEALLHEGTVPESASRLTAVDITISFGHGLRGLLPSIFGTVGLLSLWENALEGHFPELHMNHTSTLLVYGNEFSCKLPHHHGVKAHASLALIGNHFARPQQVP
eukprot:4898550-Amphidinium_carterae.1